MSDERKRTLTDADAEAVADALERRLKANFYRDLGKGFWGILWKILLIALVGIAAHGGSGGHWPWEN